MQAQYQPEHVEREAQEYWERTLSEQFDLRGTGEPGLSLAYNRACYQLRREVLDEYNEELQAELQGLLQGEHEAGHVLEPVGQRLGHGHHVRHDIEALPAEGVARAPKAGLNLIEDEQNAVAVAEIP